MTEKNTLTLLSEPTALALSHRGRGDWTTPPPLGIRVMQRSSQGRGEGMDSRLGASSTGSGAEMTEGGRGEGDRKI